MKIIYGNYEELQFESISDFKWCIECNGEVQFVWHGKSYGIGPDDNGIVVYEANNAESERFYNNADEVLDSLVDGTPLRNIVTEIYVTERTI